MKLISWNVNGLRAVERKGELENLLETHQPDILLLQEIKSREEQVRTLAGKYEQYQQWYHSAEKPGYAGTAIWIRHNPGAENPSWEGFAPMPDVQFSTGIPEFNDTEGRVSRVSFDDFEILGVYFPNGGKSPEAWKGKLTFYEQFLNFVNSLRSAGKKVIFAGDVNCAHEPIDLARPEDNDGAIGFHPDERAWLDRWIDAGWVDVWRDRNPTVSDVYSWWHVITRARDRNVGWRIDYFFVDEKLLPQVKDVQYLTEQMGSDHCPVVLEG